MEQIVVDREAILATGTLDGLPDDRARWPDEARAMYRDILGELDGWCRQHDWPRSKNTWVAEEAVRRSW